MRSTRLSAVPDPGGKPAHLAAEKPAAVRARPRTRARQTAASAAASARATASAAPPVYDSVIPPEGDRKSDPVRSRILRGAAHAFGERGYGATSVEGILEAAQVSRRTFYRAFRSKEDVLRTLFDNSVQILVRAVRETTRDHASESKSRIELAHAGVDAYIKVHADAGPLARVLLLEQFAPDSPLVEQRERAVATFIKLMSRASTRAGKPAPDPILVGAVVAAINQVCVQMATEYAGGNWDITRAKAAILRILVALDDRSDPAKW